MTLKTISLSLLSLMFSLMFVFSPSFTAVQAQQGPNSGGDAAQNGLSTVGEAFPSGAKQGKTVQEIVKLVINWALYLAAIIAVIFIIIGGFMYITSAGNETQAGKGRATLKNALIGLVLVILSYVIVQIVYNFLTNKTI